MTQVQEKFTYFKQKQAEITALYNEVEPKKQALQREFDQKADDLKAEYSAKIDEIEKPLANAVAKYRAELKAWAGITDGEKMGVLEMLMAVQKISGGQQ